MRRARARAQLQWTRIDSIHSNREYNRHNRAELMKSIGANCGKVNGVSRLSRSSNKFSSRSRPDDNSQTSNFDKRSPRAILTLWLVQQSAIAVNVSLTTRRHVEVHTRLRFLYSKFVMEFIAAILLNNAVYVNIVLRDLVIFLTYMRYLLLQIDKLIKVFKDRV